MPATVYGKLWCYMKYVMKDTLTVDLKWKLCNKISHPSFICRTTTVMTIVQDVAKWTYFQDCFIVNKLVATRSRECLVSFLPCHLRDVISRYAVYDNTFQCHMISFNWIHRNILSHSRSRSTCNIHFILGQMSKIRNCLYNIIVWISLLKFLYTPR